MQVSQPQYIEGLKAGNRKLFEEIFNSWYEPLTRYCFQRIGNQEDAEEVVQDIFVKLWLKREELSINISLNSYLYRMALNKIINYQKHLKVRLSHREHILAGNTLPTEDYSMIHWKEIQSLVAMAVGDMPKKRRMVYELSRRDGLTYNEIAAYMNISPKTVEAQLSAALKHLRKYLKDYLLVVIVIGIAGCIYL